MRLEAQHLVLLACNVRIKVSYRLLERKWDRESVHNLAEFSNDREERGLGDDRLQ